MSPRRITDVATEVAVAALSLGVTFGLARFFVDLRWRADLFTLVVASHLLALVVRRAGFGMGISAVVSAAGMLVVGNIVLFPETSDRSSRLARRLICCAPTSKRRGTPSNSSRHR